MCFPLPLWTWWWLSNKGPIWLMIQLGHFAIRSFCKYLYWVQKEFCTPFGLKLRSWILWFYQHCLSPEPKDYGEVVNTLISLSALSLPWTKRLWWGLSTVMSLYHFYSTFGKNIAFLTSCNRIEPSYSANSTITLHNHLWWLLHRYTLTFIQNLCQRIYMSYERGSMDW
jgi:hypothetical protein